MSELSAGSVKGVVNGPYPCWCEVTDFNGDTIRLRHNELIDLKHVVDRMVAEAKRKLGSMAHEVD